MSTLQKLLQVQVFLEKTYGILWIILVNMIFLLGRSSKLVKIDYKLTFDKHVKSLCKKEKNKFRALARATPYMN